MQVETSLFPFRILGSDIHGLNHSETLFRVVEHDSHPVEFKLAALSLVSSFSIHSPIGRFLSLFLLVAYLHSRSHLVYLLAVVAFHRFPQNIFSSFATCFAVAFTFRGCRLAGDPPSSDSRALGTWTVAARADRQIFHFHRLTCNQLAVTDWSNMMLYFLTARCFFSERV